MTQSSSEGLADNSTNPLYRLVKCSPWVLGVMLLVIWGAVKTPWEEQIAQRFRETTFHQPEPISREIRDSLGQGLTIAALGGFRGIAANFLWLYLTEAWSHKQWSRVRANAEMAVILQPRVTFFWDHGAWMLAWNASADALNYMEADSYTRQKEGQRYIEQGRRMLERGVKANPEKFELYQRLAELYAQKLKDYEKAAEYYKVVLEKPDPPSYAERFVGIYLEKADRKQEAYDWWRQLWLSAKEHPPKTIRRWEKVEQHIRKLEMELNITETKRIFAKW